MRGLGTEFAGFVYSGSIDLSRGETNNKATEGFFSQYTCHGGQVQYLVPAQTLFRSS